jgi:hypothetical protein
MLPDRRGSRLRLLLRQGPPPAQRGRLDAVYAAYAGRVPSFVRANVPSFAALNAAYAGVFCAVETAVSRACGRSDDQWDTVAAGAATSGFFRLRRRPAAAARSAFLGAAAFAGLEAFILSVDRHIASVRAPTYHPLPAPVAVTNQDAKGQLKVLICTLTPSILLVLWLD